MSMIQNFIDNEKKLLYRINPRDRICSEVQRLGDISQMTPNIKKAFEMHEIEFTITRVNKDALLKCLTALDPWIDVVIVGFSQPGKEHPDERILLVGDGNREFIIAPCIPGRGEDLPERIL